jgi:hypothetical protein
VLLLCSVKARGIAVFGGDHPENQTWRYVAGLGTLTGSGIYLGKRFILTANHIAVQDLTLVLLNGVSYIRDTSFAPMQIGDDDPGMRAMPLIGKFDPDFNRRAIVVGWGFGTGTEITGQGWQRDGSRVRRWGTNTTFARYFDTVDGTRLVTAFNADVGPNEMSLMLGDSGGGLFIRYAATWKLAGVCVDNDDVEQAFYDKDTTKPGNQPDHAYYVPVKLHRQEIRTVIREAVP